ACAHHAPTHRRDSRFDAATPRCERRGLRGDAASRIDRWRKPAHRDCGACHQHVRTHRAAWASPLAERAPRSGCRARFRLIHWLAPAMGGWRRQTLRTCRATVLAYGYRVLRQGRRMDQRQLLMTKGSHSASRDAPMEPEQGQLAKDRMTAMTINLRVPDLTE